MLKLSEKMLGLCACAVLCSLTQDSPSDVLKKYGLSPNVTITAVGGKATLAPGETIEFVGAYNLEQNSGIPWGMDGRGVGREDRDLFWKILDERKLVTERDPAKDKRTSEEFVRDSYSDDPEHRTFAMAFKLSPSLTNALNVVETGTKTFLPLMSTTGRFDTFVGEGRIIRPITTGDKFDFTLEVPGGAWVNLADFAFGPDTEINGIKFIERWQNSSAFKTVDGKEQEVQYKDYYFTVSLPAPLRNMELEMVTNDPPDDAPLLPSVVTQHIKGEVQSDDLAGFDLFLVHGLRSRGATRRFTLRARPRRFVVFPGIPVK